MPTPKEKNYAFIDSQNLNLGIQELGWKLDFTRFRVYLKDKYAVDTAYLFIGYMPQNQNMYQGLQKAGFVLIFKPTIPDSSGKPKGNVDADLVLQAMIDINTYNKAVVVSNDGDFYCLVAYLEKQGKLKTVLAPNRIKCSSLLPQVAKGNIAYMDNLRNKLEYTHKRKTP